MKPTHISQTNFEIPGLESEYSGDAECDSVYEVATEEPDISAPDSIQDSDSFNNEEVRKFRMGISLRFIYVLPKPASSNTTYFWNIS